MESGRLKETRELLDVEDGAAAVECDPSDVLADESADEARGRKSVRGLRLGNSKCAGNAGGRSRICSSVSGPPSSISAPRLAIKRYPQEPATRSDANPVIS